MRRYNATWSLVLVATVIGLQGPRAGIARGDPAQIGQWEAVLEGSTWPDFKVTHAAVLKNGNTL